MAGETLNYTSGPNLNKPIPSWQEYKKQQREAGITDIKRSNYRTTVSEGTEGKYTSKAGAKFGRFMGNTVNSALGSKVGQGVMNTVGSALDVAKGFVPTQESKGKNPTGFEAQQAIGDTMTKIPIPIVQMAGLAVKGVSMLAEATGGNTNKITKEQAEDIGVSKGERLLNNIVGTLSPGAGWLTKKIEEGQKSHLIDEMSNAYADTVADIDQAGTLGGGKYLFGRKKIADAVAEANRRNELLTEINMTNTIRKQSDYGRDLAQQNMNRYAGTNYMDMRMGKQGMKIQSLEEIRELLKNRIIEELDVQKFAEGGSILPVGQRHKTLHHMGELGEQFEDLTRKGIPVVTVDESGDLIQIAEIECSEWTLSKSLTDEIEDLWKDGSEEAMIECGKLVCEHLLRQTKDEGGILDE